MIQHREMPVSVSGLRRRVALAALLAVTFIASGCTTVKYSALEKVGIHKRDILVDRVEDARDAQVETRDDVVTAYEELAALIGHDGGGLEEKYSRLKKAVDRSREATDDLDEHLASIDRVSADLFKEWQSELELYSSASLRADQERKLALARRQFTAMRSRMQTARERVDPVMAVLNDNVLFLKHSLNAQALTALRGQAAAIEAQVTTLIEDMQSAIEDADAFINSLRGSS